MAMSLLPLDALPKVLADDTNLIQIGDFETLKQLADKMPGDGYQGKTLQLTADVTMPYDENMYCIFGKEDHPFKGTFDGNGYTISGLNSTEQALQYKPDTGLFGATEGATIKNLTIASADIQSDIRGGIVAGYLQKQPEKRPGYGITRSTTTKPRAVEGKRSTAWGFCWKTGFSAPP